MSLHSLDVHAFRSIISERFTFHPRFNVIMGANGSGKTSLLESIYFLSTGRSFRTADLNTLISEQHPALTVFGRTVDNQTVSIQKSKSKMIAQINQHPCIKRSELALTLPTQSIYADLFEIMDAGPAYRRSILDWGMFHVEHAYLQVWKDYRRVLKQRNALLRQGALRAAFIPWDTQLVQLSEQLHVFRRQFCEQWFGQFNQLLPQLTKTRCTLHYDKGWDKKGLNNTLDDILKEQLEMDMTRQYTHSGAHQADILFLTDDRKSKTRLSRGQQKMVLLALKLAQAMLLHKPCIYLLDDVISELDDQHLTHLLTLLHTLPGQFFLTTLSDQKLNDVMLDQNFALFHLHEGRVHDPLCT